MTTNAKSFVFESVNETDNNINMEIKKTLSGNLLSKDDIQDYSMSITRLVLPTTNINQLYFTDNEKSKYTCALRMYSKYLNQYVNYTSSLPNENDGVYYTSKERILEMINRALNNCYMQHYENPAIVDTNMRQDLILNTSTFTNVSPLSVNLSVSTTYNKFAGLKLKMDSPVIKNSGNDNQIIRLFVQSHDSIKNYLYVGTLGDFVQKSLNGNYYITENSYRDWADFDSKKAGNTSVKSYESYLKFKDAVLKPHVNIGIESNSTFSLTFQYQLSLYFSDEDTMPTQSPFISRSGNDKLYLNLQHYYYKNNHQLGFSSFLNNSMNFCTVPKTNITVNGIKMSFINYDSTILETNLYDLMILSQDNANLGKLSNISEIQLKSNALGGVSENLITNVNVAVSSNVLQEFVIFKDEIELGNMLLYSESNIPWRRIDVSQILSQSRNIDFSLWASYENGLSRQLQLAPSETFSLRLSFLRN